MSKMFSKQVLNTHTTLRTFIYNYYFKHVSILCIFHKINAKVPLGFKIKPMNSLVLEEEASKFHKLKFTVYNGQRV
jgi:hypothetical protein